MAADPPPSLTVSGPAGVTSTEPGLENLTSSKARSPVPQPTTLASGQLNNSGQLDVELHRPPDLPAFILIKWPAAPSVATTDPRAIAEMARAVVRVLAAAQTRLATIRATER